ncbi:hypothetical protein [Pseudomonas sp. RIT623]|uniref:hypothetical protein n=1 Tax=Pseudomonas sp. RIT623 TaxID=2559075 RepID=UPI00106F6128|nr:hypothetical protein [Pseudomonas sp. RIT623]TFF41665.1 hypothetical protein E3U47_07910 [Pseudomonas sp. RIT623]
MLTAILHGKAGRVGLDGQSLSWREVFRRREDLLSAVLFGRMPYLSDQAQAHFATLLLGQEIAQALGPLEDIAFWPKLGKEGAGFVEPDVVIEYTQHRILVEVKPPAGGKQSLAQWRVELQALYLQDDDSKQTVLLALGNNPARWKQWVATLQSEYADRQLRVVCREWKALHKDLVAHSTRSQGRDARVYDEWLQAFRLFGMSVEALPFRDLLAPALRLGDLHCALDALRCWPACLDGRGMGVDIRITAVTTDEGMQP